MNLATQITQCLATENLSGSELARRTGASQASISRVLRTLPVIKLGAGRNTVFAWVNETNGHPLYAINAQGQPELIATIYRQPTGRVLLVQGKQFSTYADLPWFLQSALPAGFLGRWHAEQLSPSLAVGHNPARWTTAEAWRYLLQAGDQLPGNLLLGTVSAQAYVQHYQAPIAHRHTDYDQLAATMLQHGFAPSSVAGEQPKFLVYVQAENEAYHAIVKYSPPVALDSPAAQRYRDLLIAEHLALECLRDFGVAAAESRLIIQERMYLELRRFDRVGAYGRRGVVHLQEVEAEFIGSSTHWHEAADALLAQGLIDQATQQQIHLLYAFGYFIANTDMHFGNLAFYFEDLRLQDLAPVYDMLPMFYMPVRDEVIEREFKPKPLLGIDKNTLQQAQQMARAYWQRVMEDERVSKAFRELGMNNLALFIRDKSCVIY